MVAFQVTSFDGVEMKGATYLLAMEMFSRGFVLNALSDDSVHFCVTDRFVSDPDGVRKFERALSESLISVRDKVQQLREEKKELPGTAGLYGTLSTTLNPTVDLGFAKYMENYLFGPAGSKESVRLHFLAQMDPYE